MSQHDIDPIETLRAELSRVEVSPDFAERVRRQIGEDAIASIGAELSELSVSPEFAVRVRQQIEGAPARPRWFGIFAWRWAIPVAAAATIAAFVLSRGGAPATGGVDPAGVQASAPAAQRPQAPQAPSRTSPASSGPMSPPSRIAAAAVSQRTVPSAAASGQQAEDKLEVITNQPAILRELWAAAAAGPVVQASDLPGEVREIAISPVEVGPVLVQWLVEPPAPPSGLVPNIRRVSADAERSDK